jgi:hypothetical protein
MKEDAYLINLMAQLAAAEWVNIYDYTFANYAPDSDEVKYCRLWTEKLGKEKLISFIDEERTTIRLTNFGRFWNLKGGYEVFLRDAHQRKEQKLLSQSKRELLIKEKEELIESRLKLTHFRIIGFWISLVIALTGFLISIFNLYTLLKKD